MDVYENYKAMAEELFRLKNRLASTEASETRFVDLVWRIVNHRDTKYWDSVSPEWMQEAQRALAARPETA